MTTTIAPKQTECLIVGYCKAHEKLYNIIIPDGIALIVIQHYFRPFEFVREESHFAIGTKVEVIGSGKGVIKFTGPTHLDKHETKMYGVELNSPAPDGHNGTVDGKRYFVAPEGKGKIVRAVQLKRERDFEITNNGQTVITDVYATIRFGEYLTVRSMDRFKATFKMDVTKSG
eukprot:CAMPEP_0197040916 /NCGR_PEP_ID=MMETSP1384-20130603/17545_1 /TAXON_ID=29189 /ORGANISM="Ammonia sp." /LENGTH=172 /DNA_ID=CAMNT_0042471753 /DNA_START=17 /DNA_END=531 /DNA_ORIENTATION=-